MCAKNHTCVAKTTHVWNLPLKKSYLKWLDKSTHVWEKPLSICILTKWQKPNMCGFYQTHTKYKCVWKKPHMCVKRQTCVSFSIQEVVLFVFAIVFRIFKRIYYIIPPSFISDVTMQCQKSETSSNQAWKKSPVWEFPHMCGKNHTG